MGRGVSSLNFYKWKEKTLSDGELFKKKPTLLVNNKLCCHGE